jgi:hypothetical protein
VRVFAERVRVAWSGKARVGARAEAGRQAIGRLAAGLGTAVLAGGALLVVLVTTVLCLAGVGLFLVPAALRTVRAVADRERARLSRWGPEIMTPEPVPASARAALRDPAVRRELAWLPCHALLGLLVGFLALTLPLGSVHDMSFPLWWRFVPASADNSSLGFGPVHNWLGAVAICLVGVATIGVTFVLLPAMARLQAWPGRRLLSPGHETDLALRVAELTATRAAALDAHTAELRRIERSLHDGTQNRMVAVNVLVGAARRALARATRATTTHTATAAMGGSGSMTKVKLAGITPAEAKASRSRKLTASPGSTPITAATQDTRSTSVPIIRWIWRGVAAIARSSAIS